MHNYSHLTSQFANQIRKMTDYAEYNYGRNHAITVACRSGDAQRFMDSTKHITEMTDARIVSLQNKLICAAIPA